MFGNIDSAMLFEVQEDCLHLVHTHISVHGNVLSTHSGIEPDNDPVHWLWNGHPVSHEECHGCMKLNAVPNLGMGFLIEIAIEPHLLDIVKAAHTLPLSIHSYLTKFTQN